VDDEYFIRNAFKLYLESNGYLVSVADGAEAAMASFSRAAPPVEAIVLDLVMPGTSGIELLRAFKAADRNVEVIIVTGCGSMNTAVEALRLGAYDYVTKPIVDFDADLLKRVQGAVRERRARLRREVRPASALGGELVPETSILWLPLYRRLAALARAGAEKLPWGRVEQAVWSVLAEGLGAEAAAIIRARGHRDAECLHAWGLAASAQPEIREHLERPEELWPGVLRVTLEEDGEEHLYLLALFRTRSVPREDDCPLALLGAALNQVYARHLVPAAD
jgi:CheY-like chemotaxis protein